jgi:arginyl-tRNA synthetase
VNILHQLKQHFAPALEAFVPNPAEALQLIRQAQDPKFGDYQANCAMSMGKQLGRPPREVAAEITARVDLSAMCELPLEIAGPGFINLRLRNDWLASQLQAMLPDARLGIASATAPKTFVIDYSAPNVAKPMHVGHIRSTVIGNALDRTLRFLGHRVISDNHLGDWGTQFGMIIYGYKHFVDRAAFQQQPVPELTRLYKLVNQLIEYHEARQQLPRFDEIAFAAHLNWEEAKLKSVVATTDKKEAKKQADIIRKLEEKFKEATEQVASYRKKIEVVDTTPGRKQLADQHADIANAVLMETAKLHAGDVENRQLWHSFLPKCELEIERIYSRLDVQFDHAFGESHYQDNLQAVVDDLQQRGLARESDGAICVFLDGFDTPMIIRKKDGAFLYATTDLATIQFRVKNWNPDSILYVVDHRQSEHFEKLFAAARLWGYQNVDLRHISFGTVLGEDGKPYKTRSGETVGLESLLDEAVERALAVVCKNDDEKPGGHKLSNDERQRVAEIVGHAAIKYADLSHNRTSDYIFSLDKMVALEGNTATYMQYSYARTQSIFAKGGVDVAALRKSSAPISLNHPMERTLALSLLRFEEALEEVLVDYRPNQLTTYLYHLATQFSRFFEQCNVLQAESDVARHSRLVLCDLTGRTIKLGLNLLGIGVVDRM